MARRVGTKGLLQQEDRNLELAQETYDEALERFPRGRETLLAVIRHMYVHELLGELRGDLDQDAMDARLDALMAKLAIAEEVFNDDIAAAERHQVLELARYLTLIDTAEGRVRAASLLRKWVDLNPDDLNAKVRLAVELLRL